MQPKIIFSQNEQRLFLGLVFLAFTVFIFNFGNKIIESYNNEVALTQLEKKDLSNKPISNKFYITHCGSSATIYEFIYWLQFIFLPLSFYLLEKQKFSRFIASLFLHAIVIFSFFCWAYSTYSLNKFSEHPYQRVDSFNNYLLYGSNSLDFLFLALILILFILQTLVLLRFVAEKFQAKISLR